MKVCALAGGVGGAKLAAGLQEVLPPGDLTVLVNTADDFDLWGLRICPDLDTVMYTLAGIANPQTGWGVAEGSVFPPVNAGGVGEEKPGNAQGVELGPHLAPPPIAPLP